MRLMRFSLLLTFVLTLVSGSELQAVPPTPPITEADSMDPMTFQFSAPEGAVGNDYVWSFGDGTTSINADPSHTYERPGLYVVSLLLSGGSTEDSFYSTVVQAGYTLLSQGFEDSTYPGWEVDPVFVSSASPVIDKKSWLATIIVPSTGQSCVPPEHINPGAGRFPDGFETYAGLIDLRNVRMANGGAFTFFWFDHPENNTLLFEARVRQHQGVTQIGLRARDFGSTREMAQSWVDVPADVMRFEIQAWRSTFADADGGGGHMRLLSPELGSQLAVVSLSGLTNTGDPWATPVYGINRSTFPPGSDGFVQLDNLQILGRGCVAPSAIDLLGQWDFDSSQSVGYDSSGSGRHGTAVGGVTTANGALHLDGTGYLKIPALNAYLVDAKELTVEAWINVNSHTETNVFRARQPLFLHSDRFGATNYVDGTGWEVASAPVSPGLGQWYHLAGVFNEGKMTLYLDGVPVKEQDAGWDHTSGGSYGNWAIGARIPGAGAKADQFFSGWIDNVRLYARALAEEEIVRSYSRCGE